MKFGWAVPWLFQGPSMPHPWHYFYPWFIHDPSIAVVVNATAVELVGFPVDTSSSSSSVVRPIT